MKWKKKLNPWKPWMYFSAKIRSKKSYHKKTQIAEIIDNNSPIYIRQKVLYLITHSFCVFLFSHFITHRRYTSHHRLTDPSDIEAKWLRTFVTQFVLSLCTSCTDPFMETDIPYKGGHVKYTYALHKREKKQTQQQNIKIYTINCKH